MLEPVVEIQSDTEGTHTAESEAQTTETEKAVQSLSEPIAGPSRVRRRALVQPIRCMQPEAEQEPRRLSVYCCPAEPLS